MARIVWGSTAGVAAVGILVTTAVLVGSARTDKHTTAQAQAAHPEASSPTKSSAVPAVGVTVVQPTVEDLNRVISLPAHVEPYERTNVYAKASGFVAKVMVDIGDQVDRDQVLAELWIPEMQQEQLQKEAAVEEARAAVGQAEADLAAADAQVNAAEAKRAEAQSSISQQEAELAFRKSEHARIAGLVRGQAVNAALEDEKLKQLQSAQASLAGAKAAFGSAEALVRVAEARRIQAQANLKFAQSRVRVAEADLRHTEILIGYAQIRAPYRGVVTHRAIDTGNFVASATNSNSDLLFTVVRMDKLRIICDVPETESSLVHVGQRASLVVDAVKGRSFDGRVARTAGVLDSRARTLRVEVELDSPATDLRPGMFGTLTIALAQRPQAVLLPARCIRYEGGKPFVFCVADGRVVKRPVTLGYFDGSRAEILEGVQAGDPVIVDSRSAIRPGQAVEVLLNH